MEFNEEKDEYVDETPEGDYVEIYSKRAIFWFSVFSYMFGGILLCINLWNAGYKRVVSQVLIFILFVYFVTIYAIRYSGIKIDAEAIKKASTATAPTFDQILPMLQLLGITFAINIIAAIIFTQVFFKKYFPDDDYYPKPILQPLLVFIILSVISRLLL